MSKSLLYILLPSLLLVSGCQTYDTMHTRSSSSSRSKTSTDSRMRRLEGKMNAVELENARLRQDVAQLRTEMQSVSSSMHAMEARQGREMDQMLTRMRSDIKGVIKKANASSSSSSKKSRGSGYEHKVGAGETLSAIAVAYGSSVKAIKQANNLKDDVIWVGQVLFIPD